VRGVTLAGADDEVVGMISVNDNDVTILVVSEKGYGKRTDIDDYRVTNRGGKGVKTLNVTEKTGQLVAIKGVTDNDDLMIINRSGIVIRIAVSKLRVMGRATQGVRLINLKETDQIASITKVEHEDEVVENLDALVGEDAIVDDADTPDVIDDNQSEDQQEKDEDNN